MCRGNLRATDQLCRKALELATESWRLAEGQPRWIPISEWALAISLAAIGTFKQAKTHFEQAIAGYHPQHPINTPLGPDLAVFSYAFEAYVVWLLGYPKQALNHYHRAVEIAQNLQNPFNLVLAYAYGAILHQMLQDREGVLGCARSLLELCAKYGFVYYRDWGLILSGWADSDTARIHQGLENLKAIRAEARWPYFLGLLAETHWQLGQSEEARSILGAARAMAAHREDALWLPELHRLEGEIAGGQVAEPHFLKALEVARAQESKSLELRAAMSLAKLWHSQGHTQQAYELLEPIYGWFKEGLGTKDLLQAKTLLEELSYT